MIRINRIQSKDLICYEALFIGGNLYAFSLNDLIVQLWMIYDFELSLFQFNNN